MVFLTIFIGGTIFVMICGALMFGDCKPVSPSDPCDGAGLAILALWSLVVPTSIVLGIIGGISTFAILLWKTEAKENQKSK